MNLHFNPMRNKNTLGTLGQWDYANKVRRLFDFDGKPNKVLPIKQGKIEGITTDKLTAMAKDRNVGVVKFDDHLVLTKQRTLATAS